MKICIIITHPTQFDVPIFKLGSDVIDVIYTDRNRMKDIYDPELKQIVKWGDKNLEGYPFEVLPEKNAYSWLYKKLRTGKYDLIVTTGYYNSYFIFSILTGKFLAKRNAIRLDTVLYNNEGIIKTVYKKVLYSVLRMFVDHFFVVGTLSRNFLLKFGVSPAKISTYGYVSDNDLFATSLSVPANEREALRTSLNIMPGARVLLCVSKHNEREAPFDTIQAFHKLKMENVHLVLVGDGPMHKEVVSMAGEPGNNNISFAGYVKFTDLPLYYSISDIFIHDSHNEPWGVSVQEAIAGNLAVIASDKVGAAFDMVVEGKNGYMFKAGDVDGIVNAIEKCLLIDKEVIAATDRDILKEWNYDTALRNIVAAAN